MTETHDSMEPLRSVEDALGRIGRLPPGTMLFGSLRPVALLDLRDDPARPRSGILLQLGGDYQKSFTGIRRRQMMGSGSST